MILTLVEVCEASRLLTLSRPAAVAHELRRHRRSGAATHFWHRSGGCSLREPRIAALHLKDFLLKSLCLQKWSLCFYLQKLGLFGKHSCLILESPGLLLLLTGLSLLGRTYLPQNLLPLYFGFILGRARRLPGMPVAVRAIAMRNRAGRAPLRRLVPSLHVFYLVFVLVVVVLIVLRRESLGAIHLIHSFLLYPIDLLPQILQLVVGEFWLEGLVLQERLKVDRLPVPDLSALVVDVNEAIHIPLVGRLLLPVLFLPSDHEALLFSLFLFFFILVLSGLLV